MTVDHCGVTVRHQKLHPTISSSTHKNPHNNPQTRFHLTRILRLTLPLIMDKTPIKIRGKRTSARTSRPKHNSAPKSKRPLSPTSRTFPSRAKLPRQNPTTVQQTAYIRPLSYLERLPVELLEPIFYYCLNPSLPQASITIGQKLGSTRVKSQLVLRALSSPNSSEYPCAVPGVFPTLQEQAKAQSAILRLPWMTLPFFRQLIPDYIVQTIIRELGAREIRWLQDGPMVTKENETVIRQYLKVNAARIHHTERGPPGYWETMWLDFPEKREITLGIGLQDGLVSLYEREIDTWDDCRVTFTHKAPQFSNWRICDGIEGCQIPEKLLRGPWTNEKCEFLEVVIRGNAEVDRVNSTSGEVAEQGFWEAIEKLNARAVRAMVARIGPRRYRPFPLDSAYRKDPTCKGVGVVPRQEHIHKALEEGCPGEILSALLGAAEVNFDLKTPDIQLWVLQQEKVGDKRTTMIRDELRRYEGSTSDRYPC